MGRSRNEKGRNSRKYRLVAAKKLGRRLLSSEVVHHKNGDCTDNHPDNLEVMTFREHSLLHAPKTVRDIKLKRLHQEFLWEARENDPEDILWSKLRNIDLSEIACPKP